MSDERKRDLGRRAAEHVFKVWSGDSEQQDVFAELIRNADLEEFRTRLLGEHKRRWRGRDEFDAAEDV